MGKCNWPSGGSGLDIKAKVSAADTTTDFLNSKIVVGAGLTKSILNPGANEQLQIVNTAPSINPWYEWIDPSDMSDGGQPTASTYVSRTYEAGRKINLWKVPKGGQIAFFRSLNERWDGLTVDVRMYWQSNDASHGTPHDFQWLICPYDDLEDLTASGAFYTYFKTQQDTDPTANALCITPWLTLSIGVGNGIWQGPGGSFTSPAGLFFAMDHRSICGSSGDIDILGVKIRYTLV